MLFMVYFTIEVWVIHLLKSLHNIMFLKYRLSATRFVGLDNWVSVLIVHCVDIMFMY